MSISIRQVTIEDYDGIYALWNSTEQSRRALNPVDDSREGIEKYLKRNPTTCFLAETKDGGGDASAPKEQTSITSSHANYAKRRI